MLALSGTYRERMTDTGRTELEAREEKNLGSRRAICLEWQRFFPKQSDSAPSPREEGQA
jgi:hypothetical protein